MCNKHSYYTPVYMLYPRNYMLKSFCWFRFLRSLHHWECQPLTDNEVYISNAILLIFLTFNFNGWPAFFFFLVVDRWFFFCSFLSVHFYCNILEISTRNFWKRCILNDYIYISIIQCICIYVLGRNRSSGGKIRGLG